MTGAPSGNDASAKRVARIRWGWTIANVVIAAVTVWSFTSDVWEAFVTLFLASALLQLLWMRRNL